MKKKQKRKEDEKLNQIIQYKKNAHQSVIVDKKAYISQALNKYKTKKSNHE